MPAPLVHNVVMNSRTPRWLPPVIGAVAFVAVLLGAGLIAGDWVKRNTEMRALVTQVEVSEQAMEDTQQAVQDAFSGFEAKAPLSEENRAALDELLRDAASAGLRKVTSAGDLVASVRPLPWHTDILEAQRAYLAHNQAWQDYLAAAAQDPAEFGLTHDDVNSTFAAAERPMREALPSPDAFGLLAHLDRIFAPSPAVDSGPSAQAGGRSPAVSLATVAR